MDFVQITPPGSFRQNPKEQQLFSGNLPLDFIYIADWAQMDRANYETYDTDAVYDDMDAQNQPAERVENVNNAN